MTAHTITHQPDRRVVATISLSIDGRANGAGGEHDMWAVWPRCRLEQRCDGSSSVAHRLGAWISASRALRRARSTSLVHSSSAVR